MNLKLVWRKNDKHFHGVQNWAVGGMERKENALFALWSQFAIRLPDNLATIEDAKHCIG
jgi:hypothetical protein